MEINIYPVWKKPWIILTIWLRFRNNSKYIFFGDINDQLKKLKLYQSAQPFRSESKINPNPAFDMW